MRLLALDTSTEACSVALLDYHRVDSRFKVIPQQHAHELLPMLEDLLHANQTQIKDCDAIVFGEGPGSFTGLRIAAGVAQGLAFAHQLPLIPISSLACLAYEASMKFPHAKFFLPMLDARMQEVYFALYQRVDDGLKTIIPDSVMKPEEALAKLKECSLNSHWIGSGSGWKIYADRFASVLKAHELIPEAFPNAEYLVQLGQRAFENGEFVSISTALPKYVREKFL